ncbi:MAG TPA: acyltransferase [Rhodocyclaceae bacterium]|jgi:peptidoglycan/LPS O-acetylase OafA/YrhL|nr:acyltransferase [Rhodocyclaceae bacterium]
MSATRPAVNYPALTALRGIGAVWVTLFHLLPDTPFSLIRSGYLGVDLFFMMSGFIISHVHASDFPHYSLAQHWHFLQLRLARIYPLHVFILCLFGLAVWLLPDFVARYNNPQRLDFAHFLASLFLVHNWGLGDAPLWNGPTWSLSAEWLAYITFPLITILCRRKVPLQLCLPLAVILLAGSVALILLSGHATLDHVGKIGLLRMFTEFIAGCLIWQYVSAAPAQTGNQFLLPALVVIGLSWATPNLGWMAVFGFALLLMAVIDEESIAVRFLKQPPLMLLGEASFALYLCHWPLIQVHNWLKAHTALNPIALFIGLIVAIAFTTWFCWRFVEKPSRKVLRKLIRPATVAPDSNPIVKTMP